MSGEGRDDNVDVIPILPKDPIQDTMVFTVVDSEAQRWRLNRGC